MRVRPSPWLFVALGFLMSAVMDLACPRHSDAMTMSPVASDWVVEFAAHPDNEQLRIRVECRQGDRLWVQTLVHDLKNDVSQFRVRQPRTPEGYSCVAIGMVMRNPQHTAASDDQTIGESVLIIMKEQP